MDYDDFQQLYVHICEGFNVLETDSFGILFLKHLDYSDKVALSREYKRYISEAKKLGVMSMKEYTDLYIEKKYWSKEKEKEINALEAYIESMQKNKGKLLLDSQKKQVEDLIIENRNKLNEILNEKKSIIPFTAEEYAEKKYNRFYLFKSLFKDKVFNEPFLDSSDSYMDIEEDDYAKLWVKLANIIDILSIKRIKLLAASGFFQNLLMICGKENVSSMDFYGKPMVKLTSNQIDLLSFSLFYRRCINNATEKIPEDILSSPEKLIEWCETDSSSVNKARKILEKTPNKNKTRGERSGRISSIVGADKNDYNKLGISENALKGANLVSEATDSGGLLSINQIIKKTD